MTGGPGWSVSDGRASGRCASERAAAGASELGCGRVLREWAGEAKQAERSAGERAELGDAGERAARRVTGPPG